MRVLEDVKSNSAYAPDEYLGQLQVLLERVQGEEASKVTGKHKEPDYSVALRKLDEVRLALARNLARAMVLNINDPF